MNITFALLIVLRLIYLQRHLRNIFGAYHGSPYSKVITMCVESSALIVIFSGVYSILAKMEAEWSLIPLILLPHICVGTLDFHNV